jgi:hypothetical protein
MADLKRLIGNAMNRATSSYGDPKKKSKDKTTKPAAKMPTRGASLLQSKRTDNTLSSYSSPAAPAAPAVKTAKDYRNERKTIKQEYKTEKMKVNNERKLENAATKQKVNVGKAVATATTAASGLLGIAEGAKALFKKNGN